MVKRYLLAFCIVSVASAANGPVGECGRGVVRRGAMASVATESATTLALAVLEFSKDFELVCATSNAAIFRLKTEMGLAGYLHACKELATRILTSVETNEMIQETQIGTVMPSVVPERLRMTDAELDVFLRSDAPIAEQVLASLYVYNRAVTQSTRSVVALISQKLSNCAKVFGTDDLTDTQIQTIASSSDVVFVLGVFTESQLVTFGV